VPISRPNDEQVRIPANGFTMVGTLSKPSAPSAAPLPAVLLVGGSGPTDRDELVFGIPIFGQLADTLADAGFIVLRYDRRGVGQSGGRPEAATLTDFSNDVRAAVKFLDDRRDVDSKRIAVLGYGEGGAVAMLAAAKEKRIASLVLVAAIGTTGAELNLEQVRRAAAKSDKSEAAQQTTVELQKKIQQAVLTGEGWTDDLVAYRGQADTPWFESYLAYDPARTMRDVRQPIFVLHGELDAQIPPDHADRLGNLANQRKNRPATQVLKVVGVNHLLVTATTGEIEEYALLKDKRVSDTVSAPIVAWLQSVRDEP
jgi:pimeloyl-ACP methyl ester carboxylesterase